VKCVSKLVAAGLAVGLLGTAAGCGSYYDYQSDNNFASQRKKNGQAGQAEEIRSRSYQTTQQYGTVEHNNTKLEISQPLIELVQAMDGVNSAIVALTDRYAYVAVLLDNAASGTKGSGAKREVDNRGTSLGMYDPIAGNAPRDSNQVATGTNNYETVERPEDLSHAFKQKIADNIRKACPEVQDVFISANRDFVNQMYLYARESWKGQPLDSYLTQFNEMVTKHFGTGPTHPPRNIHRTPVRVKFAWG